MLSAAGMFLLVFGLQEGQSYDWGIIVGPISVWLLIGAGVVILGLFLLWQAVNKKGEPLLPLALFRDRNFSLSNAAISTIGFTATSMSLPLIFYFQLVLGLTPTESALMLVPMAVLSAGLAHPVGKLVDRVNPRNIAFVGAILLAISFVWYAAIMTPDVAIGWLLLPSAVLGLANACVWSPISTTVTRNLPQSQAGAGSGVYNTTRQVGSVLGSAAIAALMQIRLVAELPGGAPDGSEFSGVLPAPLHDGFSTAMAQSMLLPAAVALMGAVIVLFFAKPKQTVTWAQPGE
jgi:Na+/melibiose symporter-like transporter